MSKIFKKIKKLFKNVENSSKVNRIQNPTIKNFNRTIKIKNTGPRERGSTSSVYSVYVLISTIAND